MRGGRGRVVGFIVLLLVIAAVCAGVVEAIHRLDWNGGGVVLGGGCDCADGDGGVEGGLRGNAGEEVGEGLGGDDGCVAEVLEFGFDRTYRSEVMLLAVGLFIGVYLRTKARSLLWSAHVLLAALVQIDETHVYCD